MKFIQKKVVKVALATLLVFGFTLTPAANILQHNNENVAYAKSSYTGYRYWGKISYSRKFKKLTIGAMSIVITGIIPWSSVRIATQIATLYHSMYGSNAYVVQKTYRKYLKGAHKSLLPVSEKTVYYFYKDKKHKKTY
ncbi:hypothetical protein [Listeria fleischmannii]|uniref:Uncharacterized protein n=1 Tax=Listeria fleischmannii FSL S10-1203 TaxID=1265822 RepID=W7CZZ3_9LIST|nr:hypothetical protein [Listeria fleischmannii]EUJ42330.1 hypothetical protein MCOL2_21024 [Listeria fleischmannii FSL S10-1203]